MIMFYCTYLVFSGEVQKSWYAMICEVNVWHQTGTLSVSLWHIYGKFWNFEEGKFENIFVIFGLVFMQEYFSKLCSNS